MLSKEKAVEMWKNLHNNPVLFPKHILGDELWEIQKDILLTLFRSDVQRMAVKSCNASGKAVDVEEVLPTPSGYKKMKDIHTGDFVYSENGHPVRVLGETPIHKQQSYRVEFTDQSSVVVSGNHSWTYLDLNKRNGISQRKFWTGDWRDFWEQGSTCTTEELRDIVRVGGRLNVGIPTAKGVEVSGKNPGIDPYFLGVWLGDGNTNCPLITLGEEKQKHIIPILEQSGLVYSVPPSRIKGTTKAFSFRDVVHSMKKMGFFTKKKHIPENVFFASRKYRIRVLQGIMDTDGWANNGSTTASLDMTNKQLIDDVRRLVVSLGYKAGYAEKVATLNGKKFHVYRTNFSLDFSPFTLPRKKKIFEEALQKNKQGSQKFLRTVKSITAVGVRDVKCIEVEGVHNLYLVTKDHIPTHNSFCASRLALTFLYLYPDSIVLTTAPTFRQVENILWREMRGAAERAKFPLGGDMLKTRLDISPNWYAFGASSNDPENLRGIHSKSGHVLIIADEASGVPPENLDALEGNLTSVEVKLLYIGNPTRGYGKFYDAFHSPIWEKRSITVFDTPNFTANNIRTVEDLKKYKHPKDMVDLKLPIPQLVTPQWALGRLIEWGENSPMFQSLVMAQFPEESSDTLIKLSWIDGALRRQLTHDEKLQDIPEKCIGVDVARFGDDMTVFTAMDGSEVQDIRWHNGKDLMQSTGSAIALFEELGYEKKRDKFIVDDTGVGGGLSDRLAELGYNVQRINFGSKSNDSRFANFKAEMFWNLRDMLSNGDISLIDKGKLVAHLHSVRYDYSSSGIISIVPKDKMKREGLESPDFADSLALAVWGQTRRTIVHTDSKHIPQSTTVGGNLYNMQF